MIDESIREFTRIDKEYLEVLQQALKEEGLCYNDIDLQRDHYFGLFDDSGNLMAAYGIEIYDDAALLRSVIVLKGHRGQGLGHKIIKHALHHGNANGINSYYLLTTTAGPFFSKLGFDTIARESVPESITSTNEFRTFCPDTALCMRVDLISIV